ncbi:ArsR/SmtB family transcription factor [Paenibacillus agaridevorans]|uniref:ArsR/SmtB family transcription factor n=1 Tax=Paenibacillus agaridevorans TaxID=171404 RepID=UPI001BE416BA|nr:metalloregulator ArsR/SmtB family transcription factor [Paenibacillus agaridevorans]
MSRTSLEQSEETCTVTHLDADRMNAAKIDQQSAADLAEFFKVLGDPTRVKIIHALLNQELCVHDICLVLDMAQSAVSHQLRYLRNTRMVKRRKDGKTVYYSLSDDHVKEIFCQTMNHLQHD